MRLLGDGDLGKGTRIGGRKPAQRTCEDERQLSYETSYAGCMRANACRQEDLEARGSLAKKDNYEA